MFVKYVFSLDLPDTVPLSLPKALGLTVEMAGWDLICCLTAKALLRSTDTCLPRICISYCVQGTGLWIVILIWKGVSFTAGVYMLILFKHLELCPAYSRFFNKYVFLNDE